MKKTFFLIFITIFCITINTSISSAQFSLPGDSGLSDIVGIGVDENDIDLELNPESPSAYDTVTLRLTSNSVDLNRYPITWYINGAKQLSGIGERSFKTTLGDYGSATDIQVAVKLDGESIEKGIILQPQDVTLLWEAVDSYVPPFYPGKKLPSREGIVRVAAIPNFTTTGGNILPSKQGVYIWKRNGSIATGMGGYGKDSLLIKHNKIRANEEISVSVSDVANTTTADRGMTLSFFDPVIHFYHKVFNTPEYARTIDNGFTMNTGETTIIAVPYFFSMLENAYKDLKIDWKINNESFTVEDTENPLALTLQGDIPNSANVFNLSLSGNKNIFQSATRSLNVYTR